MPYAHDVARREIMAEGIEPAVVKIDKHGRLVVPSSIRSAMDLRPGDRLVAFLEGDKLVFKRWETVEEELWAEMAGVEGDLAAELIAERREEAKRGDG